MYELSEIRAIRAKLEITQTELANIAGVSQSMIAKVEAGILDPTYTNAKKIFFAVESLSKKKKPKISQMIVKKIVSVLPSEPIKNAISKMKLHEISQIPVIEGSAALGLVSESVLLDSLLEGKDASTKVSEIMGEAPPIVSISTDFDAASHLLKFYPLILVYDKGKFAGVITKADLLRGILK